MSHKSSWRHVWPVLLAASVSAPALCASLAAGAPLSAWHTATAADKTALIDAIAAQLKASAGASTQIAIPTAAIMQCVDDNTTPDQLQIHGHTVSVTAGLAAVLCIKTNVPALATARYQIQQRAKGAAGH